MDIHGISARYPPNIHRISSGLWPMSVEIRFEANERRDPVDIWRISTVGIYEYPAQGFGSGSSRIWCFCLDPNSVFKFLWIRIRSLKFMALDPDARGWIRIWSLSDRIRNPSCDVIFLVEFFQITAKYTYTYKNALLPLFWS